MKHNQYYRTLFFSLFLFYTCSFAYASVSEDEPFDEPLRLIYDRITSLKLQEAEEELKKLQSASSDKAAIFFLQDYLDFFRIYLSEDKQLLKKLSGNESKRLSQLESIASKSSPYHLYYLGEINLHWALLYIKFGQFVPAFNRIKKAYHFLENNQKKFPHFGATLKSLGFIHALMSTVPAEYRWLVKTFSGLNGNISTARKELNEAITYGKKNNFVFHRETILLNALVMAEIENDLPNAWNWLKINNLEPAQSPLMAYLYGYVALKNREPDEAIKYLLNAPTGDSYMPLPQIQYLLGIARLRTLNIESMVHFENFIKNHKGQNNIKDAHQKLAWAHLINNNLSLYHHHMTLVKNTGSATSEDDKQALFEANQKKIPEKNLLQARLLFDGGNYESALQKILNQPQLLSSNMYHIETHYRLGRIYHMQSNYSKALHHYFQSSTQGINQSDYFQCAAYLYAGQIYESLGDQAQSKHNYKMCLQIAPKQYATSLHQKAKSGINRLNKK